MLVLKRRKDQTIIVGDSIKIMVLGIGTDRVKIGVSAPPDISVHRGEIYELIQRNALNPQ